MGVVLFGRKGNEQQVQVAIRATLPQRFRALPNLNESLPAYHITSRIPEIKHALKSLSETKKWENVLVYGLRGDVVGIGPLANLTTHNLWPLYERYGDILPDKEIKVLSTILSWRPGHEEDKFNVLKDSGTLESYLDILAENVNRENGKDVLVMVHSLYLPGLYERLENKVVYLGGYRPKGFFPKKEHSFFLIKKARNS